MGIIEALVLLLIGVSCGILSTVFDVLVLGAPSFVSHFTLWVLLNALVAIHVESRLRAILWAIPFNLGYIESYFITTVASFESYQKSLLVPLAAVALIAPLLNYALWTAKAEKNVYGRVFSVFIVIGTLVSSYLVNGKLGVYDFVVCAILAYVLLFMPVRRLKISRSVHPVSEMDDQELAMAAAGPGVGENVPKKARGTLFSRRRKDSGSEPRHARGDVASSPRRKAEAATESNGVDDQPRERPRRPSFLERRAERKRESEARKERLRAASQRRTERQGAQEQANNGVATLGNARRARRSTRSS